MWILLTTTVFAVFQTCCHSGTTALNILVTIDVFLLTVHCCVFFQLTHKYCIHLGQLWYSICMGLVYLDWLQKYIGGAAVRKKISREPRQVCLNVGH